MLNRAKYTDAQIPDEKCGLNKWVTGLACFGLLRETSRRATRMGTFKIVSTNTCCTLGHVEGKVTIRSTIESYVCTIGKIEAL